MEQTALRPKPLPGSEPGGGRPGTDARGRPPRAARRRGRRLTTLLLGLIAGTVLVLSGVGLATVGTAVLGLSGPAALQRQAAPGASGIPGAGSAPGRPAPPPPSGSSRPPGWSETSGATPRPPGATLGLEAVDAEGPGARIVAVHVPGPGYRAGLVRGDVLLTFGGHRIRSATDLARAVTEAVPGRAVELTVRHRSGGRAALAVLPGVVT
ncbi:PDZ domain-containing protein [Streptomyces asoensis]|uniref:PDZ domain-containing protein n=1 Tax=Streptomyces asoensis TaxID=249586 RepID=UPI0033DDDA78